MNGQRKTQVMLLGMSLAVILGTSAGAFVAGILPAQPTSERGLQAYAERYTGLAAAHRRANAADAYSLRLDGIHRQLVSNAWTDRLNAQAEALGGEMAADRAAQAWTDRLNGLAEAGGAQ